MVVSFPLSAYGTINQQGSCRGKNTGKPDAEAILPAFQSQNKDSAASVFSSLRKSVRSDGNSARYNKNFPWHEFCAATGARTFSSDTNNTTNGGRNGENPYFRRLVGSF
jgi:hypothetical protein